MGKYYCVFWFPTIFHCEKQRRGKRKNEIVDTIGPKSIDDKDKVYKFELTITKEQQIHTSNQIDSYHEKECRFDLIFELSDTKGHSFSTKFHCEDQSRNGFVVYSYDRDELIKRYYTLVGEEPGSDKEKNDDIDWILISFYHHAKLFYHDHETDNDCDGKYTSYYYTDIHKDGTKEYLKEAPSLTTKNNPVINWYLDQFEKQIVHNAETISDFSRDWFPQIESFFDLKLRTKEALSGDDEEKIERVTKELQSWNGERPTGNPGETLQKKKEFLGCLFQKLNPQIIHDFHDELMELSSLCIDSLIEYTYCKTLIESKYNDDYRHDCEFPAGDLTKFTVSPHVHPELIAKDERRKKAFNIRNSIRYIENVKQKCERLQNRITETLLDELNELSNNHFEILKYLKEITNKVDTQVTGIGELTKEVRNQITEDKALTSSVNTQVEEIGKSLEASEKTNKTSRSLGWLSFTLGIISIGISVFYGIKGSKVQCDCHQCHPQEALVENADTMIPTSIDTTITVEQSVGEKTKEDGINSFPKDSGQWTKGEGR